MIPLSHPTSLAKTFGVASCRAVARRRRTAKADASHCPAFTKTKLKMNLFNEQNPAAFTLIEMIVVMLIIATLAALFMGAATSVFDRARRAQAKNDVIQIVTAINAYYTEYGRYPVASTITTDAFYGTLPTGVVLTSGCANAGTNDLLFNILRGLDTTNNLRGIVFLSPNGAKNTIPPRGGVSQRVGTIGQYFDPWGSPYAIEIDSNYDGSASSPYSSEGGSAGVFKGSSDILSW